MMPLYKSAVELGLLMARESQEKKESFVMPRVPRHASWRQPIRILVGDSALAPSSCILLDTAFIPKQHVYMHTWDAMGNQWLDPVLTSSLLLLQDLL
jgi:hypothetical protein